MSNLPKVSVAILTHNELQEFHWLMRALGAARSIIDEIVIVDDFSDASFVDAVQAYSADWPIKFYQRHLNSNFASQRNFAKSKCSGSLILFPDADEIPSERILTGLPSLLTWMETHSVDACSLPRINIHIDGELRDPLSLSFSEERHSWEDQIRILRNLPHLRWTKRLHEYLIGADKICKLPRRAEYALLHVKTNARTNQQQHFYRRLKFRRFSKYWNSIAKRTFRRQNPQVIPFSCSI